MRGPLALALALALGAASCAWVARPAAGGAPGVARGGQPRAAAPAAEAQRLPGAPLRRPGRVVAVSGEPRTVPLRWQPVVAGTVEGYRIFRREAAAPGEPAPAFVEVGRVDARTTTFVDRDGAREGRPGRLEDARTYVYQVVAFGADWVGEPSEAAAASTAPLPQPPEGLEPLLPRADEVRLTWEPSADRRVSGYVIERSPFRAGPFEPVGRTRGRFVTAFVDRADGDLQRLRTYYYRIASLSVAGGLGLPGDAVAAWLKPPPLAPLDVAAVGGLARHVRLRWSAGPEHDLRSVVVWRAAGAAGGGFARVARVPAGRTEYTDAGLADGATYHYRVTALDAEGLESEPSATATATTRRRPDAPRQVVARADGEAVTVRWQPAPAAAGVARYRLLRMGLLGTLKPVVEVTGSVARDARGGGGARYVVVAIDVEGLESPPSEPVAPVRAPRSRERRAN